MSSMTSCFAKLFIFSRRGVGETLTVPAGGLDGSIPSLCSLGSGDVKRVVKSISGIEGMVNLLLSVMTKYNEGRKK